MRVRTTEGQVLDELLWRHYGHQKGALECVLNANPGLAAQGAILPAGIILFLPELTKPLSSPRLSLWD